jgi:hypothetical protein
MHRLYLFLILSVVLACGCTEDRPTRSNGEQHFSLETDPQLSPDGNYIYYVSLDSFLLDNSGIYRASVLTPIREKIVSGVGLSSPTLSPDNQTLVYIDSGDIRWYDLISHNTGQFPSGFLWNAIVFVDTSELIACRDSFIELINIAALSAAGLGLGFEPDNDRDSTYIISTNLEPDFRLILRENYWNGQTDTLLKAQFPGLIPPIRSPSKHPSNDHLVFSIRNGSAYDIYSARGDTLTVLGKSNRSGVEIVADDLVLFTGPVGLLYRTTVSGGMPLPWVHVEDPD